MDAEIPIGRMARMFMNPADHLQPRARYGAPVPEGAVARARAALSRGDVLIAYDLAVSAMEAGPENLEARFLAALALARAGAIERARTSATELLTRIEAASDVPISLCEDAAALVACLAKDEALATEGEIRRTRLREAADLYEAVADKYGRFYTLINASTLRLLAGDRERARRLARQARALVTAARRNEPEDDYWREATEAEASLVLGRWKRRAEPSHGPWPSPEMIWRHWR